MPDLEKVINGIEHCIGSYCDAGGVCPYLSIGDDCDLTLRADAIELLKAQDTVDAIPLDWLREKMRGTYKPDSKAAWRVLKMWEQEGKCGEKP